MTLQRDLYDINRRLNVQSPIIAKPEMLKITLALGCRLEHCNYLGSGLHNFGLVQHTSASRKVFKVRSDQHQVIMVISPAPYLDNAATLAAPDGVSLPTTLSMVRGIHIWLSVVLSTLFGANHPTALAMQEALHHAEGGRLTLTRGVHQSLAEFHLLTEDISICPTRMYELIPIHPTMGVYHYTVGYMCGGAVLL